MKRVLRWGGFVVLLIGSCWARANAQDDGGAWSKKKSAWLSSTASDRGQVQAFAEDYKAYLNVARSALTSARELIRRARAAGFTEIADDKQVQPGARLILPNRDRGLVLVVVGSEPIVDGSRVVGAHHDSPHIDLKARPFYPASGFAQNDLLRRDQKVSMGEYSAGFDRADRYNGRPHDRGIHRT